MPSPRPVYRGLGSGLDVRCRCTSASAVYRLTASRTTAGTRRRALHPHADLGSGAEPELDEDVFNVVLRRAVGDV